MIYTLSRKNLFSNVKDDLSECLLMKNYRGLLLTLVSLFVQFKVNVESKRHNKTFKECIDSPIPYHLLCF